MSSDSKGIVWLRTVSDQLNLARKRLHYEPVARHGNATIPDLEDYAPESYSLLRLVYLPTTATK